MTLKNANYYFWETEGHKTNRSELDMFKPYFVDSITVKTTINTVERQTPSVMEALEAK